MPKREGVRQFLRELYAGNPRSEVLITSREYYDRFYGNPEENLQQRQQEGKTSKSGPADTAVVQPTSDPVTRRLVLRLFDAPLDAAAHGKPQMKGGALIVGDNPAASALRSRAAVRA